MVALKSWGVKIAVVLAVCAVMYFQYQANIALTVQVVRLGDQLAEIERVQKANANNIRELAAKTLQINKAQTDLSKKAKELERKDAELKQYFDTRVPASASWLLNQARTGGRITDPVP